MKILVLADVEDKALWDYYSPDKVEGIDLIISCGDLHHTYLEYLVTMTKIDILYVHGNHDTRYEKQPPEGCINIEDQVYIYKGLRILGLGGSYRYKPGTCMYTEKEMAARIRRLLPEIRMKNGFDILVTHAPAAGYGDMEDLPHRGFLCFNALLEKFHPKYMLHGHVHASYQSGSFRRMLKHPSGTTIINCYDKFVLEIDESEFPRPGKTGSALFDIYTAVVHFRKPKWMRE